MLALENLIRKRIVIWFNSIKQMACLYMDLMENYITFICKCAYGLNFIMCNLFWEDYTYKSILYFQSFVKRVASRVTELLPQPSSWLSRWLAPSSLPNVNDFASHSLSSTLTSRQPATSRAELNLVENVDNHIPAKKPRIGSYGGIPNREQVTHQLLSKWTIIMDHSH